jgi:hypothetical protein
MKVHLSNESQPKSAWNFFATSRELLQFDLTFLSVNLSYFPAIMPSSSIPKSFVRQPSCRFFILGQADRGTANPGCALRRPVRKTTKDAPASNESPRSPFFAPEQGWNVLHNVDYTPPNSGFRARVMFTCKPFRVNTYKGCPQVLILINLEKT